MKIAIWLSAFLFFALIFRSIIQEARKPAPAPPLPEPKKDPEPPPVYNIQNNYHEHNNYIIVSETGERKRPGTPSGTPHL